MKNFENWETQDLEIAFDLHKNKKMTLLEDWLSASTTFDAHTRKELGILKEKILDFADYWNEDELKMLFIAPLLVAFDFKNPPLYRVFTQRLFSLQTEEVEAGGRVEWLVATGKQTPKKPFFFLQEYKPEKTSGNDPLGQLLIAMVDAMVDAQILNETPEKPLFGCYMIGRLWFFIVLKKNIYSVSRAYDATQTDDLGEIFAILEKVKAHIHKELGLPAPIKMTDRDNK